MKEEIYSIYRKLQRAYGPQGWWPLVGFEGTNPTKTGSIHGYHVGDYSFPRDLNERFEICIGAILTQHIAWPAVERSLVRLAGAGVLSPEGIARIDSEALRELIRPSGYHNQKSRYLKAFVNYFLSLEGKVPPRDALLELLGIGPETADTILLYAFREPEFVVDAYTRRIFAHRGILDEQAKYAEVKRLFEESLREAVTDQEDLLVIYQEYHALIVEHTKRCYAKKPYGRDAILTG